MKQQKQINLAARVNDSDSVYAQSEREYELELALQADAHFEHTHEVLETECIKRHHAALVVRTTGGLVE